MYHGVPGLFEAVLHAGNLRWITQLLRLGVQKNKEEFASHKLCYTVLFVIAAVLVSVWNCVIV